MKADAGDRRCSRGVARAGIGVAVGHVCRRTRPPRRTTSNPPRRHPPRRRPPAARCAHAAGRLRRAATRATTCHYGQGDSLKGTPHAQAKNPRSPAATHGCESCHGPGQAHVDDDAKGHILKFGQMKPAEVNETCLACHNRGDHAGWEGSTHERRNLSCTTCHSVHSPKSPERQLVKATEDRSSVRRATGCR